MTGSNWNIACISGGTVCVDFTVPAFVNKCNGAGSTCGANPAFATTPLPAAHCSSSGPGAASGAQCDFECDATAGYKGASVLGSTCVVPDDVGTAAAFSPPLVCTKKVCAVASTPAGQTIISGGCVAGGSVEDGTSCTYACADGYKRVGFPASGTVTATCADEVPVATPLTCTQKTCTVKGLPIGVASSNCSVGNESKPDGFVCDFRCGAGFTASNSSACANNTYTWIGAACAGCDDGWCNTNCNNIPSNCPSDSCACETPATVTVACADEKDLALPSLLLSCVPIPTDVIVVVPPAKGGTPPPSPTRNVTPGIDPQIAKELGPVATVVGATLLAAAVGPAALVSFAEAGTLPLEAAFGAGGATSTSSGGLAALGPLFALILGQAQFITMQSQVSTAQSASYSEFLSAFRWLSLQGLAPGAAVNSSGANTPPQGGSARRLESQQPPASKVNVVGKAAASGLNKFCKIAGIPPEALFPGTMILFVAVVVIMVLFQGILWCYVRFLVVGRGRNPKLLTVLKWRFQGAMIRVCYFGFYAVSSTAVFQIYLQTTVWGPAATAATAATAAAVAKAAADEDTGADTGAAATSPSPSFSAQSALPVTIAAGVSLTVLSLVLFGATSWIMRSGRSTEERVDITIGSLLLKPFNRKHRAFWVMRPLQILVISLSVGLLQGTVN